MSVAWEPGSQNHKSEKRLSSSLHDHNHDGKERRIMMTDDD